MNNKDNISDTPAPFLPALIGTALGAGYWPWGPGTAGSLVGVAAWMLVARLVPWQLEVGYFFVLTALMLILIALFTWLGTWATARLQPMWGEDPSRVVIDEVVGQWTALLAVPLFLHNHQLAATVAAFVLFRLFDMWKPLGIRSFDRRQGAFWVMADDLLAGLYAFLVLVVANCVMAWAA